MDVDWWKALDRLDESLKRSHEAARRREEVRQGEEAAAAYERHVAEYEQYMAAYERYEAKAAAAAVAMAEEENAAAVEREVEAERERAAAEAEEDAAEKYEQSATVTVFFGSSKAFSFGFLNKSCVLPKINAVLPQFNAVLPQFRDLGLEIVFPQISDLRFAVSPKIGNSVLSGGVLGDYGGDSAIDGAGRPPRKPPDSFFCSGELCFLVADSWRPVLCVLIDLFQIDDLGVTEWFQLSNSRLLGDDSPQYGGDVGLGGVVLSQVEEFVSGGGRIPPRQPPDFFLCGEDLCFLAADSCKPLVKDVRPPQKPPDVSICDGAPVMATRPPLKLPDLFMCGRDPCFYAGESWQLVTANRPPAKPPDSAKDGRGRKRDEGVKGSILAVTVKGKRPPKSGCLLNPSPSPIRVGQAQVVQRRSWALLVLGLAGNKKKIIKAKRCIGLDLEDY